MSPEQVRANAAAAEASTQLAPDELEFLLGL
jgi:hypothetical protein